MKVKDMIKKLRGKPMNDTIKRTVGRPPINPKNRRKVLSVSIPQKLITALRNRATQENGISSIVEKAIKQFLDIRS